jgi:predicted GNAT family acetyltransferase
VLHGGNVVPIGGDPSSWRALGEHLAHCTRLCTSIVGPAAAVHALWEQVGPAWGPARDIRASQPLLVLDDASALEDDDRLHVLGTEQLEEYLPAATAMFTEELGVSPLASAGAAGFRHRCFHLLESHRVYGVVGADGSVLFKADIGALTGQTCQIQGVWVRPDLRGQGFGTVAMAAVLVRALQLAPTASLYVNDFNEPARRLYARLGMRQLGELATVLF